MRAAQYRGADPRAWQVQLRAPVAQLRAWWERRLQVRWGQRVLSAEHSSAVGGRWV